MISLKRTLLIAVLAVIGGLVHTVAGGATSDASAIQDVQSTRVGVKQMSITSSCSDAAGL